MNHATTTQTPTRFHGRSNSQAKKSLPPGTGLDVVLAVLTETDLSFDEGLELGFWAADSKVLLGDALLLHLNAFAWCCLLLLLRVGLCPKAHLRQQDGRFCSVKAIPEASLGATEAAQAC